MNSAVATYVQVDRQSTNPIENLAEFLGRLPGRFTDLLGQTILERQKPSPAATYQPWGLPIPIVR